MPMMFHSQENAPESQTQAQTAAHTHVPAPSQMETQTQGYAQGQENAPAQQERRYDPDTLRRMTEVATRLQHDHYDKITAGEMESIGAEVGLKPEFVQQALAQMDAEHANAEQEQRQQEAAQQAEQYTLQQRKLQQKQQLQSGKTLNQTQATGTKAEFYSVCAALAAPLLFGLLAYHFKSAADGSFINPRTNAIQLFTLIAPVPLALLQGFAAGKRRVGFMAAAALIFALAPTVPFLGAVSAAQYQQILTDILSHLPEMVAYTLLAVPIAGAFGVMGAWMRQRYFPFAGSRTRDDAQATHQNGQQNIQHKEYGSAQYGNAQYAPTGQQNVPYQQPFAQPAPQRMPPAHTQAMHLTPAAYAHAYLPYQDQTPVNQAFLHQNAANQTLPTATGTTHAAQSLRRAYLSVDVADLDSLRQSATLAAVDYSFGQLRAWTEAIVHICGGSVHHDAAVGLLASFPTDAQAARAARLMQERVSEFNHALNRLPVPFRLRCGLSAGEGANAANSAARERSQSLLRTAKAGDTLVGSEMGAAILSEMGPVAPASSVGVADAFVWRPEQAAPPAH